MLDIPSSSLRRYARDYAEYFSETARSGGVKRRYDDQDVLKIKRIKQMARARETPEAIRAALETEVVQEPKEPEPVNALALMPRILEEFESIRAQLSRMETDRESDRQTMSRLESELERLSHELEEQRRPLWDKIRRRFRRDQET